MAEPRVSVFLTLVDQLTKPLGGIQGAFDKFGSFVKGIGSTIAAGFSAAAIGAFFKSSVEGAAAAEKSVARLNTALGTVGLAYKQVAPEVEKYLQTLQRTTRFSDEDGREALTTLVTITGDYRKSLDLMSLSADVAAKRNVSLSEGAALVGKASIGVTKGLADMGIVTKDADDAISQLRTSVGGFAEAEGQTFGARVEILNNLWEEFKERIGTAIINNDALKGSMVTLADELIKLAEWVDKNGGKISGFISGVVKAIEVLIDVNQRFNPSFLLLKQIVGETKTATDELIDQDQKFNFTVTAAGGKRVVKTKEQLAEEEAARKKAAADRERLEKQSAAALKAVQETADEAQRTLLTAQHEVFVKAIDEFHKQTAKMTEADQKTAEESLTKHLNALVTKYGGIFTEPVKKILKEHGILWAEMGTTIQLKAAPGVDTLSAAMARYNVVHGLTLTKDKEDIENKRAQAQQWADWGAEVSETAGKIGDAAVALEGLIGTEATDKILEFTRAVEDLGAAAGRIATGDIVGGITQGIGALIGLGQTIFGSSSGLGAAIKQNIATLDKLRTRMGDLIGVLAPGRDIAGIARVLESALPKLAAITGVGQKVRREGELGKELVRAGFSLKDLDELAASLGIRIRDDKGNLQIELLRQLLSVLGELDAGFAETFAGQRERIRGGVDIGAITDPLGALLALINDPKLGVPAIAAALAGLDLETTGGRASAIDALQDLFTNLSSVGAAGLGGANRQQFLEALGDLITLLGQGVTPATGSIPVTPPGTEDEPVNAAIVDERGTAIDFSIPFDTALTHLASIDHGVQSLGNVLQKAFAQREAGGAFGDTFNLNGPVTVQANTPAELVAQIRRDWATDLSLSRAGQGTVTL